jgi:DNA-binding SARP family transcriptional activator
MTRGSQLQPTGPGLQIQQLLIKLLVAGGMPVANDELKEVIWDDVTEQADPSDALRHLMTALRKTLAAAGLPGVLPKGNGTYRLDVSPDQVDVHVFHALTDRARLLDRDGDPGAVRLLEQAVGLRYGEPLAGLPGRWIDGYRFTLVEEIRAAELALYQSALRHGESRQRLPGLSTLLRERPDDELVAWLYMNALYRAGQPTRALEVKRDFAAQLLETNGTENGRALDDLYQRILARDDDLLEPEALDFPGGEPRARPRTPGPDSDQEDSMGDSAREDRRQQPEPAGTGPHLEFHGAVHAPFGVFGTQVNNYGAPR